MNPATRHKQESNAPRSAETAASATKERRWRALAGGEVREAIDIDAVINALSANRATPARVPVADIDLTEVLFVDDLDDVQMPDTVRDVRAGLPGAMGAFDPSRPLPGETDAPLARPARLLTRDRAVPMPDPTELNAQYEALRAQRDIVAEQAKAAYAEIHALRHEALCSSARSERAAQRAIEARERAARRTRDSRRLRSTGRRVSAAAPEPDDTFRAVHDLRVDAIREGSRAKLGSNRVAAAREDAARLLAEQHRLEAEMDALLAAPE